MNYALTALDASGSMSGRSEDVAKSMNEYAGALPEDTHLSVFMFDSNRWLSFFEGEVRNYPQMRTKDHVPGAMTPLYDRCAQLIAHGETLAQPGDRAMIMVDTDGVENYSTEHNQASIEALVETRKNEGWAFLFMSEGLDRAAAHKFGKQGHSVGMAVQTGTVQNRMQNYKSAALQTKAYLSTGKMPESMDNTGEEDVKRPEPSPFLNPPRQRPQPRQPMTNPAGNASTRQSAPSPRQGPEEAKPWNLASRAVPAGRS